MAAMSTICHLNLTPPATKTLSPAVSFPNKTTITQVSRPNKDWGKQWAVGMACVVISLEILGNVEGGSGIAAVAMAKEETAATATANGSAARRWSEKRKCPSWKINSLETIVPENLPRPITRRRWESVGYVNRLSLEAAANDGSCFNL